MPAPSAADITGSTRAVVVTDTMSMLRTVYPRNFSPSDAQRGWMAMLSVCMSRAVTPSAVSAASVRFMTASFSLLASPRSRSGSRRRT